MRTSETYSSGKFEYTNLNDDSLNIKKSLTWNKMNIDGTLDSSEKHFDLTT